MFHPDVDYQLILQRHDELQQVGQSLKLQPKHKRRTLIIVLVCLIALGFLLMV